MTLVSAVLLGVVCVPLGALSLYAGASRGFKVTPLALGLALLAMNAGVVWLARRGSSMSVRHFSDEGLVRNDGRGFAWADLSRVVDRVGYRRGLKHVWRTEIQFKGGGSAWVIPPRVANYEEVREYVLSLPCEHVEG